MLFEAIRKRLFIDIYTLRIVLKKYLYRYLFSGDFWERKMADQDVSPNFS